MRNTDRTDIQTTPTVVEDGTPVNTPGTATHEPAALTGAQGATPCEAQGGAVSIRAVTKEYVQWQRSGKARDILKSLLHPEKRVVTALDDVSLDIAEGEFVAYAGANGAGKSTTLKILSGILQPTRGEVRVLGLDPAKDRIALMRRVGVLFGQRTELWWDHPIATSFDWKATVWDIPRQTYEQTREEVVALLDIGDLMKTFARELSLGQRMRADLGLMLLHRPELILLDEPTLGLDVLAKRHMIEFLKRVNRERGTTIVVTSHDMDDLEEMAQRIVLLSEGRVAFDGGFDDLRTLTGSQRHIRLTTDGPEAPVLASATWLASEESVHEYAFDANVVPVATMLAEVSTLPGVLDMETRKAPIERVIAGLYRQWRAG